jgi:hypothetical protein
MPFDEEKPKDIVQKVGLKPVAGQKSMFDQKTRNTTPQEFRQQVQGVQEKSSGYNKQAAELFVRFSKAMSDKTLAQNKNVISSEVERELLNDLINFARDMNNDANEEEDGMGSITCIIVLLKTCLAQRDRLNQMEYALSLVQKKFDSPAFVEFINKEITKALDAKKNSE